MEHNDLEHMKNKLQDSQLHLESYHSSKMDLEYFNNNNT